MRRLLAPWLWRLVMGALPVVSALVTSPMAAQVESYSAADESCPSEVAFTQRVRTRQASRDPSMHRVSVRIERENDVFTGAIALAAQPESERRISSSSCEGLADALSLIAVLMLGEVRERPSTDAPAPATRQATRARPSTQERPPTDRKLGSAAPAAAETPPATQEKNALSPEVGSKPAKDVETASPEESVRVTWRAFVGLSALVMVGETPAAQPGLGAYVGLATQGERATQWAAQLGARLGASHREQSEHGLAAFRLSTGVLSLCAMRVMTRAQLALGGCGTLEAGALRAEGSETRAPDRDRRFWLAAGPAVRLASLPWRRLVVALSAEALLPSRHHQYLLAESTVHSVPWLTFRGELAVATVWP